MLDNIAQTLIVAQPPVPRLVLSEYGLSLNLAIAQ